MLREFSTARRGNRRGVVPNRRRREPSAGVAPDLTPAESPPTYHGSRGGRNGQDRRHPARREAARAARRGDRGGCRAAIGPGLAKAALAIKVDGALRDLDAPLPEGGAEVAIVTERDPEALELIRHDAAHVMAEAVTELYPGTKVTIGPPIESGFYYDFEFPADVKITEEDLPKIEEEMRKHIDADEHFSRRDVPVAEALDIFRAQDQGFKVELIEDLVANEGVETVSLYKNGHFEDLCRGPHSPVDQPDQGDQAELGRGRLLARRRAPRAADPDLRHRLLLEEGPRGAPRADRRGRSARPPPARPRARPLHAPPRGARDAVLAAQRHHAPAPDRRPGPRAAAQARLPRDRHAAGARRGASGTAAATGTTTRTRCTSCRTTTAATRCGR